MDINEFNALPMETQKRLLKRVVYQTVPPGEVKETAAAAGIEDYTLYKMRDENNLDNYFLIRPELIAIMHHRGNLRPVLFILELFGLVAVRLPRPDATAAELKRETARAFKVFGEYLEHLSAALDEDSPGGNKLTAEEYRQIAIAADTATAQIAATKEAARLAMGGKAVKGELQISFGGKGQA